MVKVTRRRARNWRASCSCGWQADQPLAYFDASQVANAHRAIATGKPALERSKHLTVITRVRGPGAE